MLAGQVADQCDGWPLIGRNAGSSGNIAINATGAAVGVKMKGLVGRAGVGVQLANGQRIADE